MAYFLGAVLAHSIDPIRVICILLVMVFAKKWKAIYVFIFGGLLVGFFGIWLTYVSSDTDIDATSIDIARYMLLSIISSYVIYGIFSLVNKLRLNFLRKRGHILKDDET